MFFFVALRWAPRPFGGARAQKKTPPRVFFFFALAPCRRPTGLLLPLPFPGAGAKKKTTRRPTGLLLPLPFPGAGAKKKKHPGWCFFFALAPCRHGASPSPAFPRGRHGASPSPAFPRGRSKKKNTWVVFFFFALAPCRRPTGLLLPLPFAGAAAKKNSLGGVFFFALAPCRHGASPSPAFPRGRSKKKNTLGGVFFFAAAPRGRSPTHCGPGWRCLPLAGVVFVFFAAGRGRTGVVFFFLLWPRQDAHSLTVGWGDFGKARVGVFFFLLRPRRVFLDNNKKCLGYYIGSKKTRRGHSKKKKKHFPARRPKP